MFPYFEREGATTPALEFLTAVKGPGLPQITVATGIGQYSGAEAAAVYDEDVKKQAQQLGLPGW
jgi:raffinose/stachyose/melibiose transport system substrate-binding protein